MREEEILSEEQAGFRSGRGTVDHIFALGQLVEKMWERNRDIYCVFIDFKQAFDSVWRNGMVKTLEQWGFEPDIIRAIKNIYDSTTARVNKGNITTDSFPTTGGVIQGCPLAPHLFNLFLEWVMRMALEDCQGGVTIGGDRISNLRYADDIVLLAENKEDLQEMVDALETQCRKYKLNINKDKTKSMHIGRTRENLDIRLTDGPIEQLNDFKYLGVYFTARGGTEKAVTERIKMGQMAFGRLRKIWSDTNLSTELKLRLLQTIVIPTALYGSECWVLRKKEEQKLLAFESKCLRRILGIRWYHMVSNERVRERANLKQTILDRIKDSQRRWFGHVQRMDPERWPVAFLNGRVSGNRPRGRPRDTWIKSFRQANNNKPISQLTNMARDRDQWRSWRHQTWDPTWRPPDGT